MKQNPVYRETGIMLLGEIIGVGLMFGVYAILHRLTGSVLRGGALGGLLMVLNFFFMGVGTSLAADRAESGNVAGGKALIVASRIFRMLLLFGALILAALTEVFDLFALVIPFFFQQPILLLGEFFRKSGDRK